MATLGSAYVQIIPSADGISSDITNVLKGDVESAGNEAGSMFGDNLVKTLKTVLIAAGIGSIIKSAIGSVGELAEVGDNIDKMSQKMGISAQAYQEWDAILQHSGSSIEAMKPAFKTLVNAAESGSEAFQELGISQEEIASMNQEQLFSRTISALQNMESGTERAYYASKLLGKGGSELGALLNTSAEDTELMRQRVHELGGVMSDEAVKNAAAYQDALQDMQTAMQGLGRGLVAEFLPGFTQVMDGITQIFSGDAEGGVGKVVEGLSNIGEKIVTSIPQFVANVGLLVKGVLQAIAERLPSFMEKGGEFITNMVTGLMQKLPDFINNLSTLLNSGLQTLMQRLPEFAAKGMELVGKLASGILSNLPAIVGSILNLVTTLIRTLLANLPQFAQKGVELVGKLISGIVSAIPNIISTIVNLISQMKNSFNPSEFITAGFNMLMGIATGIGNAISNVVSAAIEAAKQILGSVKNFFGIKSPSRVMAEQVGKWIPAGIAEGIQDNMRPLDDAMSDLVDDTIANTNGTINAALSGDLGLNNTSTEGSIAARLDAMIYLMQEYYPDMAKGIDGKELVSGIDRALGLAVV